MPSSTNVHKVQVGDYLKLEGLLKGRLTKSGMVYNVTKLAQTLDESSKISIALYADEPSPQWSANTTVMGVIHVIGLPRSLIVVDGPENGPSKQTISRILSVLDWSQELQFEGVENSILPTLVEEAKKLGGVHVHDPIGLYYMTEEEALNILSEKDLKVLNDSHVRGTSLRPSDAAMVQDRWSEKVSGYYEMLHASIDLCSSGGIYLLNQKDGEDGLASSSLVSFAVALPFGSIHAFHTEPEERRKGYGKLTMKVLAKNIATAGRLPLVQIFKDNDGSKALNEGIGFKYSHDVNLIIFTPN